MSRLHATIAILGLSALAASEPALAKVGVAAAVAPSAWGAPPAGADRLLATGADLEAGDRLRTDARGSLQVLFQDGSSMALGPDAELTLDEYLYKPEQKGGTLGVSLGRGLMRFVGGAISKENAVTVRTPTATIGIRGGIAIIESGATTTATLLYGLEMTVEAGGRTVRLERPGFRVAIGADGMPETPHAVSNEALGALLGRLEPGPARAPGGGQQQAAVSDDDVAQSQVALLNDIGSLGEVETAAGETTAPPPPSPDGVPGGEVAGASGLERTDQSALDAQGADRPALQPASDATPDATPDPTPDPGPQPPSAAGSPPTDPGPAGPTPPAGPSGPMTGRIKFAADPAAGADDADAAANLGLQGGSFAGGVFEAATADGRVLRLVEGPAGFASEAQPFGASPLTGDGLILDPGFLVFELIDGAGGRAFAFAGEPTPAAALPQSGAFGYQLGADFLRGQNLPFLDDIIDAASGSSSAPGRVYVAWNDDAPGAQRAVAGGSVAIFGRGAAQQRASSIFVGRILDDADGRAHLQARLFGLRRTTAAGPAIAYGGGVASSDGTGGADFFGADGGFVLEAAQVDGSDATLARGIARGAGGAIFPNHVASAPTALVAARTTRSIAGFAGGLERSFTAGLAGETRFLTTAGQPGVSLSTDAALNTLSASFALRTSDGVLVQSEFGSAAATGAGAFIDDLTFAALSGSIAAGGAAVAGDLALVASSALQHRDFLPAGVQFCACEFVVWGFWGGEREAAPGSAERRQVELASWVAGSMSDAAQIVGLPVQMASYGGHLIGEVATAAGAYQAAGRVTLNFDFAPGGFRFAKATIAGFDGANLSGLNASSAMLTTNAYTNTGVFNIVGAHPTQGPIAAQLNGAFFGPGGPPLETAGEFTMTGAEYRAAGTYAARR